MKIVTAALLAILAVGCATADETFPQPYSLPDGDAYLLMKHPSGKMPDGRQMGSGMIRAHDYCAARNGKPEFITKKEPATQSASAQDVLAFRCVSTS